MENVVWIAFWVIINKIINVQNVGKDVIHVLIILLNVWFVLLSIIDWNLIINVMNYVQMDITIIFKEINVHLVMSIVKHAMDFQKLIVYLVMLH